MLRCVAWGAVVAAVGCTTPGVAEPVDVPGPAPAGQQVDVSGGSSHSGNAVASNAAAGPAPAALPYNCEAPLTIIEETTRFLTTAATHATSSSACVDGPGQRVTIDEVLVCPAGSEAGRQKFAATYRVSTWEEGGDQGCGADCPKVVPSTTQQRIELRYRSVGGGKLVLEPPADVPGMPLGATPATSPHDGDCYGKSPAFVPSPVG